MNLERAYMLMLLIKEAGLHGGLYKPVATIAEAELKALTEEAAAEVKERAEAEKVKLAAEAEASAELAKAKTEDLGTENGKKFQDELKKNETEAARREVIERRKV